RSSTPRVPPGFTANHAQPTNVALFNSPTPSQSSVAVTVATHDTATAPAPAPMSASAPTPQLATAAATTVQEAKVTPTAGDDTQISGDRSNPPAAPTSEKPLDSKKEARAQKAKEREERRKEKAKLREEVAAQKKAEREKQVNEAEQKVEAAVLAEKHNKTSEGSAKQKPVKLDLATGLPMTPTDHQSPKVTSSAPQSVASGSVAAISVPSTPSSTARVVELPAPVQVPQKARVLRLVDTPKSGFGSAAASTPVTSTSLNATHDLASATHAGSSATAPGETGSEVAPSSASASASRSSSPPPSRIGSAPVRTMTKNQQKKERRIKAAKQVEAKKEETPAVPDEPEQAPIISRKRKTKKVSDSPASGKAASLVKNANADKDKKVKDDRFASDSKQQHENVMTDAKQGEREASKSAVESIKTPTVQASEQDRTAPATVEKTTEDTATVAPDEQPAWVANNTFEQLFHDCEATGESIKQCFIERLPSLADIYTDMHMAGELDLDAPLHNPPPLSLRTDIRCTAADFGRMRQPIRLTNADKAMLSKGIPVRINGDSDNLKDRCLITPGGAVLRHLSAADEDRYLELEKVIAMTDDLEYWQDFPNDEITEPDLSNRGGNLETILANPEKFNVQWLGDVDADGMAAMTAADADIAAVAAMSAPSTRPPFSGFFTAAGLPGLSQHLNEFAKGLADLPGAQARIDALQQAAGISLTDGMLSELPGMTDEELRTFVETAQSTLEVAKKEAEAQARKAHAIAKDKTNLKWAHMNVQMCAEEGWHGRRVVEEHYGTF
ncbi:transcriptional repressor general negative regulator of transcription subunit 4, partial [Ascosphaera acerosa]